VLQCVAVCCSVLQCVAVCCSVLQFVVCGSVSQCVAVCCSVLQCVSAKGPIALLLIHVYSIMGCSDSSEILGIWKSTQVMSRKDP